MNKNYRRFSVWITGIFLILLIVDTDTATAGAEEGVILCIKVIIPSLFPFFVVTSVMNSALLGQQIPGFHGISKCLRFPSGGDSLLLLGLVGGYPVGAKLIADNCTEEKLSKRTGQILLGYCNNAGPAFIFGIAGSLFSAFWIAAVLWTVHILSALITAFLLPRPGAEYIRMNASNDYSVSGALKSSIHVCASVCGWIIVFKTATAYLDLCISKVMPVKIYLCLSGFLEISNGCLLLKNIPSEAERFVLCSSFLSFGGLCVLLQTISATKILGLGLYLPGKIMQTAISTILSSALSRILFHTLTFSIFPCVLLSILVIVLTKRYAEKSCGNFASSAV